MTPADTMVSTETALEVVELQATLPVLIERASRTLADAKTSGEVLEARDIARAAYDAAKSASRMTLARQAHDEIVAAIRKAQGDAGRIIVRAEMRLADELDAAKERGEIAKSGRPRKTVGDANGFSAAPATTADISMRRDEVHEARKLRDAEKAEPGKLDRVIDGIVERGEEPTKAAIRREMIEEPEVPNAVPAPTDPERRKLAKLTHDALIDEVLGLRADLVEAKAEAAKLKTERDALKKQVKELSASDTGTVIRNLQQDVTNANNARWREGEKAAHALKQVHGLKKELKALGRTEIPL